MVLCHESELDTSMFQHPSLSLVTWKVPHGPLNQNLQGAQWARASAKSSWILMRRVCSFFWWEPFKLVLCKGAKNMMATWNLESARWKK